MDEIKGILDPDEHVIWSKTRPILDYFPKTKKRTFFFWLIPVSLLLLITGTVLGIIFHLIPHNLFYTCYYGMLALICFVIILVGGIVYFGNKKMYEDFKKFYSEEQLSNFNYIDALTNKNFIQRIPHFSGSEYYTEEEKKLFQPFSKIEEDFIKLDLTQLRNITITRTWGLKAELDFNQSTKINVDKLSSLNEKELNDYFYKIPTIPTFEIYLKKNETLIEFLTIIKGELKVKTKKCLVKNIEGRNQANLIIVIAFLFILLIPSFAAIGLMFS